MNPLVAAFLSATPSVGAAIAGYSGLLHVPTAEVRENLSLSFNWLSAPRTLLGTTGDLPVNRTYLVTVPFFPNFEGTLGLLQIVGWSDPQVPVLPYLVHRTLTLKIRLPLPWYGVAVAFGVVDPVSANFLSHGPALKTHYGMTAAFGVATYKAGPLAVTVGGGLGDRSIDKQARSEPFLDGLLAGLIWALPGGFQLLAEWDGFDANVGTRWNGPWGIGITAGRAGGGWLAGSSLGIEL
ncbi:MAG: hypothetical protein HY692_05030 [Cyanobacteria bacterium NC_groundwater_1444_Ag_S-0.65um_54_12]|nr:hypothetical protein [Cyanobacteria bacterium NC_groundwater_1444_Ag_S-0.65um_54_12]